MQEDYEEDYEKIFLYAKGLKFGRDRSERCTDGKRKQRGGKGKVAENRKWYSRIKERGVPEYLKKEWKEERGEETWEHVWE